MIVVVGVIVAEVTAPTALGAQIGIFYTLFLVNYHNQRPLQPYHVCDSLPLLPIHARIFCHFLLKFVRLGFGIGRNSHLCTEKLCSLLCFLCQQQNTFRKEENGEAFPSFFFFFFFFWC